MRNHLHALWAASLALGLCIASAHADYVTTFSTPPYTLNQSAIGVDGWDYRLPTPSGNPDMARVVAVRWNGYKPALMLKAANLKNIACPATTGVKVKITFELAVNFPDGDGSGKQFRLGFADAPFGEIFFDPGAEGGLGYQADGSGHGDVVALRKADVKINSFYTYIMVLDYTKMTYDLTITGMKKDESAFNYKSEGVAFESKKKTISAVYIISGRMTAYLASLAIKSE